jgi:hypothetical protein
VSNLLRPVLKSAILVAVATLSFGNAGETGAALIAAIDHGDSAAVQRALESKPDLEPACDPYAICKPLALAASHGDLAMVKMLLAAGADPNGRNAYGDTAFMVVGDRLAAKGKPPTDLGAIRTYLLRHGADPDQANDDGATVFTGSAAAGDVDALELCLQRGGGINHQATKSGYTPLMAAAQFGQLGSVRWLLAHGGDARLKDSAGRTALQIAKAEKHDAVVTVLTKL